MLKGIIGRMEIMELEIFDPSGSADNTRKYHHAPRLVNLNGKTIGEISNQLCGSDRTFPFIREALQKRVPNIKFVPYTEFPSGADDIDASEHLGDLVAARSCDAVIGGNSALGGASTSVGRALARIEKKGIPTFSITCEGFAGVVCNAFQSLGFSCDASQYEFPFDMFLADGDLTIIEKNIDKIINGLTIWDPEIKGNVAANPPKKMSVEGADYSAAIHKMNIVFLNNRWGDGLPLLPATEERVNWLLTGIELPRDTVIGQIMPSGRMATVESLAVNLAMTEGRPEYMPVLVAAMRAFTHPLYRHELMQTTTCSVNLAAIVNGPVGKQIRLNAGYGCLGPDPRHPAGVCIGRAIRLIQQNVGQAIPESGTMAVFGGPLKYANAIFAEDEDGLPPDWEPLNVEKGFAKGSNVMTIHAVATSTNISSIHVSTEETALETLHYFSRIMGSDYGNIFINYYENSAPGILIMPRGIAQGLAANGWSKKKVKEFLWQHSKFPWSVVTSDSDFFRRTKDTMKKYVPPGEPWPISIKPDNLLIVVAGGKQSGHGYWMRMGAGPIQPVSVEIELPKNWEALIMAAEEDFGPLPTI
jgi:hypothetical protein